MPRRWTGSCGSCRCWRLFGGIAGAGPVLAVARHQRGARRPAHCRAGAADCGAVQGVPDRCRGAGRDLADPVVAGGCLAELLALALFWLWRGISAARGDLRIAGLALLTAVTFKVFLIDAAALDGILRILSLLAAVWRNCWRWPCSGCGAASARRAATCALPGWRC